MMSRMVVQVPDSECGTSFPQMSVVWVPDENGPYGWKGDATFRHELEGPTCSHEVYVGLTSPAAYLHVAIDQFGPYSSTAVASVPFADLTGRDLVWAAWWAFAEIRRLHARAGDAECRARYEEAHARRAEG